MKSLALVNQLSTAGKRSMINYGELGLISVPLSSFGDDASLVGALSLILNEVFQFELDK